jgi:hypothetical protein
MDATDLTCQDTRRRRQQLRAIGWNGLDFVEIDADFEPQAPGAPPILCAHFFGRVPEGLVAANVQVQGGRRIRNIQVTAIDIRRSSDPEIDDCLRVTLDRMGDLTTYQLCLVDAPGAPLDKIDPRYRCVDFVFQIDCVPCQTAVVCPPAAPVTPPEINYLAKDYESFRQVLLDRIAVLVPDWTERHAADLGVALVEVLAYTGDSLSYFQDAVATEAYLDTAQKRISVRRHARLVDYAMHEGNNARAFLTFASNTDLSLDAGDVFFTTGLDPAGCGGDGGKIRSADDVAKAAPGSFEVFEPMLAPGQTSIAIVAAHTEIEIYTWGDTECCLPQGATRATLRDGTGGSCPRALKLAIGDLLLLEEVIGPGTGRPEDADPTKRHVVRLTDVEADVDPVFQQPVLNVAWDPADALPFPLCLSVITAAPTCQTLTRISVARGNVILVDHGATVTPDEPIGTVGVDSTTGACRCDGTFVEITETAALFRPSLAQEPVTFREPLPVDGSPAAALLVQDPRQALPVVTLFETPALAAPGSAPLTWMPHGDLLDSGPDDRDFVAENDDQGIARLRFGDGDLGRQPPARSQFTAHYRVGNGPAGNVGRDTITEIVLRTTSITGVFLHARNPLPATGGAAPEPIAEVKQLAPGAFRRVLERAITAADYATLAEAPGGVPSTAIQGAAAELQWSGSWYEAHVAVDPLGSDVASADLLASVAAGLAPFRRIRHDLRVAAARYVPLDIALDVCVLPHHIQRDVVAAVLDVLSNRRLANGRLGFFHPDRLTFGQGIFLSQIVAAAQAVPGVQSVNITTFKRLFEPASGELASGVLPLRFLEIAQLDNDPNEVENGRLTIHAGGGR